MALLNFAGMAPVAGLLGRNSVPVPPSRVTPEELAQFQRAPMLQQQAQPLASNIGPIVGTDDPLANAPRLAEWQRPSSLDAFLGGPPADAPMLSPTDLRSLDFSTERAAVANAKFKKPGFFEDNGMGERLLKGFGQVGLHYFANQGNPAAMAVVQNQMLQQRAKAQQEREDALRLQDRDWALQDAQAKANQPEYFSSGRDRVRFDPATGKSTVVYDGAEDFETYASALGLKPGTEEYGIALQDFVLRGSGPTAYDYDVDLEGVRQTNRERMEGMRQGNRVALRGVPTYAQRNGRPSGGRSGGGRSGGSSGSNTLAGVIAPILAKVRDGKPLTPGEQKAFDMYRPGRGGRGGSGNSASGPIAKSADGRTVQWNGKAWVPVR